MVELNSEVIQELNPLRRMPQSLYSLFQVHRHISAQKKQMLWQNAAGTLRLSEPIFDCNKFTDSKFHKYVGISFTSSFCRDTLKFPGVFPRLLLHLQAGGLYLLKLSRRERQPQYISARPSLKGAST